jgi:hypothetical protein
VSEPKLIIGTPYQLGADGEMAAPFSLAYIPESPRSKFPMDTVQIAISTDGDTPNHIRIAKRDIALESFYELREAVNDLYDHIRQEQSSD